MSSSANQVSRTYRGKTLFRNSYQSGLFSIFFAGGPKPLDLWEEKIQSGYINRYLDPELKALVVEIGGTNVSTTYITCPKNPKENLGIRMPFLVMVAKNLKKYFTFEVTVLDHTEVRRRFRVANFQSTTQILPMSTVMPIGLADGWNQIQFNLSDFTYRAYKKQFAEVLRVKVNANILLRRIYFADRLLSEEELPDDYKLFFPLSTKGKKRPSIKDKENKQNIQPQSSKMEINATVEKVVSQPILRKPSMQSRTSIQQQGSTGVITVISEEYEAEYESLGSTTEKTSEKESAEKQIDEKNPVQLVEKGVPTELQVIDTTKVIEGITDLSFNEPEVHVETDTIAPQAVDADDNDEAFDLRHEFDDTDPKIAGVKSTQQNQMTEKDYVPTELQDNF